MLRRIVGGRSREHPLCGDGKIVGDDRAALHERKHSARNQKHSREIGCDDFVPLLDRELAYGLVGMRDSGIVYQNVDVAKLAADCRHHLFNVLLIPDIAWNRKDANLPARQLGLNLAQARFIAPTEGKVTSFDSKGSGDCKTNTLRGSGYKCDFSL